ncbi:MAG: hypothetical protein Q4F11_00220 [Eubacteriales bacterium]|nr:hypothetical protein [Eubacteriales bacterium]
MLRKNINKVIAELIKRKKLCIAAGIAASVMLAVMTFIVLGKGSTKKQEIVPDTTAGLTAQAMADTEAKETIDEAAEEITSEDVTEEDTLLQEDVEQFIEDYVSTIDEEALPVYNRTLTNECIPYDGVPREISCWGDSMTQGVGAGEAVINVNGVTKDISYVNYPEALQLLTGIKTNNFGVGGETSLDIAIRQGGYPMYTDRDISLTSEEAAVKFICPALDNMSVTLSDYSGRGGISDESDIVYIGDIPVKVRESEDDRLVSRYYGMKLKKYVTKSMDSVRLMTDEKASKEDASSEKTTETAASKPTEAQTTPAVIEKIDIPVGTKVMTKTAKEHQNDILILEIGSNGGWESNYQQLIEQYDAMIENSGCRYYIIIGDTDDPGTSIGDLNQGETYNDGTYIGLGDTSWEATLREAYGAHFINMRTYLLENGLSDCGMEPTQQDMMDMIVGNISKQLRADWTHLNSYGYYSKGMAVYKKGIELGYWS